MQCETSRSDTFTVIAGAEKWTVLNAMPCSYHFNESPNDIALPAILLSWKIQLVAKRGG